MQSTAAVELSSSVTTSGRPVRALQARAHVRPQRVHPRRDVIPGRPQNPAPGSPPPAAPRTRTCTALRQQQRPGRQARQQQRGQSAGPAVMPMSSSAPNRPERPRAQLARRQARDAGQRRRREQRRARPGQTRRQEQHRQRAREGHDAEGQEAHAGRRRSRTRASRRGRSPRRARGPSTIAGSRSGMSTAAIAHGEPGLVEREQRERDVGEPGAEARLPVGEEEPAPGRVASAHQATAGRRAGHQRSSRDPLTRCSSTMTPSRITQSPTL